MLKNISCAFAAFLIFGLVSVNAYGANATDTTNNRTIGGYVYSWVEWAVSFPKAIFLQVDSDIVLARADLISDIKKLRENIERTGFHLESISVGMELVPSVSLALSFDHQISDQDKEKLNTELLSGKFNILERALIDALLEAASVKIGSEDDNLILTSADVDVDIIPGITLTFEEETPVAVKN